MLGEGEGLELIAVFVTFMVSDARRRRRPGADCSVRDVHGVSGHHGRAGQVVGGVALLKRCVPMFVDERLG